MNTIISTEWLAAHLGEVRLLDAGSPEKAIYVRRAVGPTKKKAEQDAARQILEQLNC